MAGYIFSANIFKDRSIGHLINIDCIRTSRPTVGEPPTNETSEFPGHVCHIDVIEPQCEIVHADVTLQEPRLVLPVVEVRAITVSVEWIQFHFTDRRYRQQFESYAQLALARAGGVEVVVDVVWITITGHVEHLRKKQYDVGPILMVIMLCDRMGVRVHYVFTFYFQLW